MTDKSDKSPKNKSGRDARADADKPSYMRQPTGGGVLREWVDVLVFAYVLAMFIRTFVVELFKVPTGSMTPTLVGDAIYEGDYDDDGDLDLIIRPKTRAAFGQPYQVFIMEDSHPAGYREVRRLPSDFTPKIGGIRYDRICVNKMAYLFHKPERGDIAVFKTPPDEFDPNKPIYVKRICALPNETVSARPEHPEDIAGRLTINGEIVDKPPIYKYLRYTLRDNNMRKYAYFPYTVPAGSYMMFGDNTRNSSDSRRWGPVRAENIKGKAFLRYWPIVHVSGDSRLASILGAGKLDNFGLLEQSVSKLRWLLFLAYIVALYFAIRYYSKIDHKWKLSTQNE